MSTRFDDRGWNVASERRVSPADVAALRKRLPAENDSDSKNLDRQFRLVCLGFVVVGIIGLLSGAPIPGIG